MTVPTASTGSSDACISRPPIDIRIFRTMRTLTIAACHFLHDVARGRRGCPAPAAGDDSIATQSAQHPKPPVSSPSCLQLDEERPDAAPDLQDDGPGLGCRQSSPSSAAPLRRRAPRRRRSSAACRRRRDGRAPPSRPRAPRRRARRSDPRASRADTRSAAAMSRTRNSKFGSSYFFISRGSRGEVSSLTDTFIGLPSRTIVERRRSTRSCTAGSSSRRDRRRRAATLRAALPSSAVMTSPTLRPAASAAPPKTRVMRTPVLPVHPEPLGQLARQHLHRNRHPRLARLEPRILETGPAELDRPSAAARRARRMRRAPARVSCLPLVSVVDDALERLEGRPSACSSTARMTSSSPQRRAWHRRRDRPAGCRGRGRRRGWRASAPWPTSRSGSTR